MTIPEYDGIVISGGGARRLGGVEKPLLEVGGRRCIDVAVSALAGARRVIVVGPDPGLPTVIVTREEPAGGGPVAALAAGLTLTEAGLVVVLAADLPFVTPSAVRALVEAADGGSAITVDDAGRDQLLLATYPRAELLAALPAEPANAPLRPVVALLTRVTRVTLAGDPPPWLDCDTPEQLAEARRLAA